MTNIFLIFRQIVLFKMGINASSFNEILLKSYEKNKNYFFNFNSDKLLKIINKNFVLIPNENLLFVMESCNFSLSSEKIQKILFEKIFVRDFEILKKIKNVVISSFYEEIIYHYLVEDDLEEFKFWFIKNNYNQYELIRLIVKSQPKIRTYLLTIIDKEELFIINILVKSPSEINIAFNRILLNLPDFIIPVKKLQQSEAYTVLIKSKNYIDIEKFLTIYPPTLNNLIDVKILNDPTLNLIFYKYLNFLSGKNLSNQRNKISNTI